MLALVLFSSGLSTRDQSKVLKERVQLLMTGAQTGDPKQVETPLLDLAILPDHAGPWFVDTYGPVLGKSLYEEWEGDVFKDLPSLLRPVVEARNRGRTQIKVTRLTSAASASEATDKGVLRNQKKPRALYIVEFVTPGGTTATKDLYYFAIVNGRFGYVGDVRAGPVVPRPRASRDTAGRCRFVAVWPLLLLAVLVDDEVLGPGGTPHVFGTRRAPARSAQCLVASVTLCASQRGPGLASAGVELS